MVLGRAALTHREPHLVIEIRDNVLETLPTLPNHHVERDLDVVKFHKRRAGHRGARQFNVSCGYALCARYHYQSELPTALLDQCEEVLCVHAACNPLSNL